MLGSIILLGRAVFWGLFLLKIVIGILILAAVAGGGSQEQERVRTKEEIRQLKLTIDRGDSFLSRLRDSLGYIFYGSIYWFFGSGIVLFGAMWLYQVVGQLGFYIFKGCFFAVSGLGVGLVISVVVNMFNGFITKRVIKKAEIALESFKQSKDSTKEIETKVRYSGYWVDPVTGESLIK